MPRNYVELVLVRGTGINFVNLCRRAKARGNLITDTYWGALAIESGSEWDHDGS
jgi:hypothetical protein